MNPEHRTKSIKIAVTDDELKQLKERSTKPRLAEWMRETCLGTAVPRQVKNTPKVDPTQLRHLAQIGNNLNQIARWLNRHDQITPEEKVKLLSYLVAIEQGVNGDR